MNKFIILCLFCLPFVAHGLKRTGHDYEQNHHNLPVVEVSDEDLNAEAEPQEPKTNMVEDCFIKILSPSITCIMKSLTTWDTDVFQLKHAINHKPTCCATWQITDCLVNKAKVFCTPEENLEFNLHMNDLTEKRNQYNCTEFQYQSNTCHESTDEEETRDSVITNVLVRDEEKEQRIKHQAVDEAVDETVDKPLVKPDIDQLSLNDLGEFKLAQRLLDRVNRITIHKVVIDLHPVNNAVNVIDNEKETKTHETDTLNKADSYFDP